jgi:hypothetical protein
MQKKYWHLASKHDKNGINIRHGVGYFNLMCGWSLNAA